jgi:hypothetical protein
MAAISSAQKTMRTRCQKHRGGTIR